MTNTPATFKQADGMTDMDTHAYSVETLAARWDCTGTHIRNLIKTGKIRAFKVGKLTRISAATVTAFEQGSDQPCQTSNSNVSTECSTPSGMTKQESAIALRSARVIARRPKPPLSSSNVLTMPPQRERQPT